MDYLRPLYGVVQPIRLRSEHSGLAGYRRRWSVRIGNAAVNQVQHDVYGSIIMAATPMFSIAGCLGQAMRHCSTIEPLGEQAAKLALEPDALHREYRGRTRVHTHLRHDVLAGVNAGGEFRTTSVCPSVRPIGRRIRRRVSVKQVLKRAWNPERKAFTASFDGKELDASALLLAELGLV